MPMTLATIARLMIEDTWRHDIQKSPKVQSLIAEGVSDLPICGNWHTDVAVMEDRAYVLDYPEVEQFIGLLRHFARTLFDEEDYNDGEESGKVEAESREDLSEQEGFQPSRILQPTNPDTILRSTRSETKVTKRKRDKTAMQLHKRKASLGKTVSHQNEQVRIRGEQRSQQTGDT